MLGRDIIALVEELQNESNNNNNIDQQQQIQIDLTQANINTLVNNDITLQNNINLKENIIVTNSLSGLKILDLSIPYSKFNLANLSIPYA